MRLKNTRSIRERTSGISIPPGTSFKIRTLCASAVASALEAGGATVTLRAGQNPVEGPTEGSDTVTIASSGFNVPHTRACGSLAPA